MPAAAVWDAAASFGNRPFPLRNRDTDEVPVARAEPRLDWRLKRL